MDKKGTGALVLKPILANRVLPKSELPKRFIYSQQY